MRGDSLVRGRGRGRGRGRVGIGVGVGLTLTLTPTLTLTLTLTLTKYLRGDRLRDRPPLSEPLLPSLRDIGRYMEI